DGIRPAAWERQHAHRLRHGSTATSSGGQSRWRSRLGPLELRASSRCLPRLSDSLTVLSKQFGSTRGQLGACCSSSSKRAFIEENRCAGLGLKPRKIAWWSDSGTRLDFGTAFTLRCLICSSSAPTLSPLNGSLP